MRNEIGRDFGRRAVDQVQRAVGQAGIDEGTHQFGRRGRRLFRPLDDNRAAGGKSSRQFAHRLVEREIPRREGSHRADRLLDYRLADAIKPRRHDAAIGTPRLLGEPVDDVGCGKGLHARFGDRLALLQRHQRGDMLVALAQDVGGLAHQFGAVKGRDAAPCFEPLRGSSQCFVEIVDAGMGERAKLAFRRRIDDRHGTAVARAAP